MLQFCSLLELLVNQVESKAVSGSLHPGDEVGHLLLGLHLLLDVLALQEVGEAGIAMAIGGLVQLQQ